MDDNDEEVTRRPVPQNPKLRPPKRLRNTAAKCCVTCRWFDYDGDVTEYCQRPSGPTFLSGTHEAVYRVCDYHEYLTIG